MKEFERVSSIPSLKLEASLACEFNLEENKASQN